VSGIERKGGGKLRAGENEGDRADRGKGRIGGVEVVVVRVRRKGGGGES